MIAINEIKKFRRLSRLEKYYFFKAYILCFFISLMIKIVSPKIYLKQLVNKKVIKDKNNEKSLLFIKLIQSSITRASKLFPWKLTCLTKSICFKLLSNNLDLDCVIAFNAININGSLVAHSSIRWNNQTIYLNNAISEKQALLNI